VKAIPISFVTGILISLALFWLMQMMISNNQQGFKKTDNVHMTEFVRLKRETKLQTKDRKIPDEPPPPENRPPPPQMEMQQMNMTQSDAPQIDMPNLDIPLQTDKFSGSLLNGLQRRVNEGGMSNTPIPLVQIKPVFPIKASNRGITKCWVKFKFTLTAQGFVKNPRVIDSKPKKICNKSAMRAFKRWKFKPRSVAGKAIESHGETIPISFKK
jgi:protein TonB